MIFNSLFGVLVFFGAIDPQWVDLEKKSVVQEEVFEEDQELWVLFLKKMSGQEMRVYFPSDPVQFGGEEGSLIIRSEKGGELFELKIERNGVKPESAGENEKIVEAGDLICRLKADSSEENRLHFFDLFSWNCLVYPRKTICLHK